MPPRVTPEVDGWRQRIQSDEDRGTGRGEPRHHLEIRIGKRQRRIVDEQRHGRSQRHAGPGQNDQQVPVSGLELARVTMRHCSNEETGNKRSGGGNREALQRSVAKPECRGERQYIKGGKQREQ